MNQRVLAAGNARPAEPARSRIADALAEITGQPVDVFLGRLDEPTPWFLDLPNAAEAQRLADWVFATSGLRATIVPAVGSPAPSRAAGLAFLEEALTRAQSSVHGRTVAEDEAHALRARAARDKARALADERGTARRPSGPLDGSGGLALEARPARPRTDGVAAPDAMSRPHAEFDLKPERPVALRVGLGLLVVLLVGILVGPYVAAPFLRGRLSDHLDAQLRRSGAATVVDRAAIAADVARVLRDAEYAPEGFRIGVFVADDVQAAALELKAGFSPRTPDDGLRLRVRVEGDASCLGREVAMDSYVDVFVPREHVTGRVDPSWADFVRLDAP
jgi:hypothetical protein